VSAAAPAGQIVVLAGTNGAGKSSIAGEALRGSGSEYFNPDEATRRILASNPDLALDAANSIAWGESLGRLRKAIAEGGTYAFETTLGGNTIPATLLDAAQAGAPVRIFYVGLASVEQHVERVRRRVARGGHDIPEKRIRVRYDSSRKNLVKLLPYLAELEICSRTMGSCSGSFMTQAVMSVSMRPGWTQLTRIPSGVISAATLRVSASRLSLVGA
jgi:predicted ABC-type ATPase